MHNRPNQPSFINNPFQVQFNTDPTLPCVLSCRGPCTQLQGSVHSAVELLATTRTQYTSDPLLSSNHAFTSLSYFLTCQKVVFTFKASLYLYNPMVCGPWVGRYNFSLGYIILRQITLWLILDIHTPCPHFAESLHHIDQNSIFKPQNPTVGGSAAQQVVLVRSPDLP